MELGPEPAEQTLGPGVAKRVAGWICPERKIHPNHGAPCAHIADIDDLDLGALEAAKPRCARPGRIRTRAEAQPRSDARLEVLTTQPPERIASASPAAIAWALTRSHCGSLAEGASLAITRQAA
jgi:hypothetical protein